VGSESWLKPDILNSEIFPDGYNVYRKDRFDGYGGVFLACHQSLISCELDIPDNSSELCACQIDLPNNSKLIVCSVYRPPSSDIHYLNDLCKHLESIKQSHPNAVLWIGGDINLPDINWEDNFVEGHAYPMLFNNTFIDFLNNNGLLQMVNSPTRGNNILDIFITNRPATMQSCETIGGISDHEAVLTKSFININLQDPSRRLIYLWSKADFNLIRENIQLLCQDFMSNYSASTPINVLWNKFTDICDHCLRLIPTKTASSKFHHPWITTYVKRLTRRKQRAYNRAKQTNHPENWTTYFEIKRLTQQECRKAYNKYISSFIDSENNCTKKLWSFIKSKRLDQTGIGPIIYKGETHTDSLSKANAFADYFASVYTQDDPSNIPTLEGEPFPEIHQIYIHPEGVAQLLHNLKPYKAAGPDNLPSYFLKEVAKEIAPSLCLIFQASLDQGVLPDIWKSASVVPIYKKGKKEDPSNYRPVSLTCICSKILEHVIYSCIFEHLDRHQILTEQQHGFRQHRSCVTQLISTIHDFAQCLNDKRQCDVLLLDFCKAFDKVPFSRLFYKLYHYGIRGTLLIWIKNFLSNRSQRVILDNKQSSPTDVLSGVPQGTVLAPLLFLIFINDISVNVQSKIRLYADDVVLYRDIRSIEDCYVLQNDLDLLAQWSYKWQMMFNPKKCEFLRISNKSTFVLNTYYINNHPIKEVTHAKYLGVIIDQNLSWNEHIKQISSKATKVNAFLYRNLYHCPVNTKLNCYKAMVRPILEYASPIWDPHTAININHLESVQRSAARLCYKDYSNFSSVTTMLRNLNLPTLKDRRNRAKLQMMYKITNNLVSVPNDCLTPAPPFLRSGYFNQMSTRIDSFKFSFFPSTIKLWNSLPPYIVNSSTHDQFCTLLDNYQYHTCAL